jgi:ABC-type multidrug transport system fused ATPase/permease subunit
MVEVLRVDTGNKLLDSRLLVGWGRVSMALVIPVLVAFYALVIPPIHQTADALQARLESLEKANAEFNAHMAVVDTNMIRGKADREKFQADTAETLKEIRHDQMETVRSIATLTTMAAQFQAQIAAEVRNRQP